MLWSPVHVAYQIGPLYFRPEDGMLQGLGKIIRLTDIESQLLALLCAHPEGLLSGRAMCDSVWPGKGDLGRRDRLDTHLTSLRKKLHPFLSNAIENIRGKGYRLQPKAIPNGSPPVTEVPERGGCCIWSLSELDAHLRPQEENGALEPGSQLVIHSPLPLETLPVHADRMLGAIVGAEIGHWIFIPANAVASVPIVVQATVGSMLRRRLANGPITQHPDFALVSQHLRLALTPYWAMDSVYILNATNPHSARAFQYGSQDRRAFEFRQYDAAAQYADQLKRTLPDRADTIIQIGRGLDRAALYHELRDILSKRLGAEHPDLVEALVPETRQGVLPFPSGA